MSVDTLIQVCEWLFLLYFLGLPVGRDMDGYARTDLFSQNFTAERPITFIPTYDR